ncbi:MAG: hypothetical protein ACJ8FU_08510 [Xanthobacteraceae bacterium]
MGAPRGNKNGMKHGLTYSPEYTAWCHMRARCHRPTHPRFADYGGRGIAVCSKWRESFEGFFEDMGPRPSPKHSLERKDNEGHYEPSNCVWALPERQNRNARFNRFVTLDGERLCLKDAAKRVGLNYNTVLARLYKGWSVEAALTFPVDPSNAARVRWPRNTGQK